jgi:sugar (pentulose or hexulose) kinase
MIGGVLGKAIEASEVEEATPLGAAMLAGIGVGLYRNEDDAYRHVCRPGRVYAPDREAAAAYARLFPIYRQIYPALHSLSHQLSTLTT